MDILPLVILLLMGVVISSTCGRYSSSSVSSSVSIQSNSASLKHQLTDFQKPDSHRTQCTDEHHDHNINNHHQNDSPPSSASSSSSSSAHASSFSGIFTSYTFLRRQMLKNTSVTCNDGTVAGYYLRRSFGSRRWVVFLEGGWFCYSTVTCHQRWLRMRNLMTSAHWPEAKTVGGILSSSPEENPYWWNANHVFVPYCSSDIWSGDSPSKSPNDLSFLGARIVEHVISELLPIGLSDAKLLLLSGSSAGAVGVMLNLDRIAKLVADSGSKAEVRGLADSGWFLDNGPFMGSTNLNQKSHAQSKLCVDPYNCAPLDGIKAAHKFWTGRVPSSCASQFPTEPWRCYFGYRLYSTLRSPLFVFQWLYDEAQMHVNGVVSPQSSQQWQYVQQMANRLRVTLENVTAVFAPSCLSHVILTKHDWNRVTINAITLPQAIRCWELNHNEPNKHHQESDVQTLLSDSPNYNQRKKKRKRKQQNARRRHKIKRDELISHNQRGHSHYHHRFHHERHRWLAHEDQCHHWLVDTCNWPQCNRACPKLHKVVND